MDRAWWIALLVVVALSGCLQPERSETPPQGGAQGNVTAGAGGNATAGNQTGNATVGAYGNATVGNQTGNATGNQTGNATANQTQPQVLHEGTHTFAPDAPENVTFEVAQPFLRLTANATATGVLAGLKVVLVDPGGNETVVLEGTLTAGSPRSGNATVPRPAQGTWTLEFSGTGTGSVEVEVRGA